MTRVCARAVLGFVLMLAGFSRIQADESVPSDPVFVVQLTDGTIQKGRIAQLDLAGTLKLDGPDGRTMLLNQVVSLVREGLATRPLASDGSLVLFPEGDRLKGIIGVSTDTALQLLPAALGDTPTAIPLESLLGVVLTPPAEENQFQALLDRIRKEPRDAEVLWLSNDDRQTGSLLALGSDKIEFRLDAGPVAVPRSSVVALGFDPAVVKYPRPSETYLELTFTDGSRLGVSAAQLVQGRILAKARFGAEIHPDLKSIAKIHVRSEAVTYLSDVKPAGSFFVGYLGRHPEVYGTDSTWNGFALRLAGQYYDRGLSTLPRTLLAYRLDERDRRFQTIIGVDDRAGELASVVFRVLVDETERFVSPPMTRRDAPRTIDLDVSGAKRLILITEFGDRGDIQDIADWIEPRLIR